MALYSYEVTQRDKLGRIVQREETVEGVTTHYEYAYDLAGRLTDVWTDSVLTAHYTFDANGNRLSKVTPGGTATGTYDLQDRVQMYGGFSYVFDDAGFLLAKTETATSDVTEYEYDVFGNLRTVALPDGRVVEYEIDARNRRVGKKVDGVVEYRLLYVNQLEPVAMLDGGNNVVATFVYGSKSHVPELMIAGGVTTYRYVTDHLGSVRLVVNAATGAVAQRIDYDEFGVVTSDTNPGWQPFGFAGGVHDGDTGLVRFGARDYDAATGRWTARDPALFDGNQSNLYVYVAGNPVVRIDPTGLAWLYYWEPKTVDGAKYVGHVSLMLDDGTYISYWPGDDEFRAGHSTPARPADIFKDIEGEDGLPQTFYVRGLYERAIQQWWSGQSHGDYTVFNNCSNIVAQALRVGGLDLPNRLVYHPKQLWNDVRFTRARAVVISGYGG